ncbi:MAG: ABC transporter ATP-binding protein/permease [Treponema sp.]|uniref:ABC transporter ATP-binding protein/permease n=1 Tax=Treponema sp. TaxID=166 RepID=UPI0025E3E998|nr:ABC transporter ATP-binding protein/permease [Treponema sp.]MBQ9283381.1 ABC transporter ATP-binding protein/permease [Treponema sp.]
MMIDKRLVNFVPEAKKFVFLTVALRFLSLVSNTTFIFATAFILRAVKKGESFLIPFFLIALCLLASLFVNLLSSYTSFRSSSKVKITLRSRIYEKLLRLGSDYLENSATAKVIQTATDGVEQIETWFSAFLPQFYYSMIAALFTFTVISLLNLRMALVLLACVPLIPLSMAVVQGIAKKILGKYWAQYANLADNFLENLQGLTTLQIYQADGFKAKQMAKEAETFRRVTMKVLSMQLNSIIIMDVVAYGGVALGIICALSAFYSGQLSFDRAFVCILLSADFFIPLRRLGSAFHTAMNGVTASKTIFELLDSEESSYGKEEIPSQPDDKNIFSSKNLSCNFGERVALKDCTIDIERGSFTAFVGKSGSGKSTLAKIFSGIYGSYSGSIKIQGIEAKEISRKSLYSFVTYISHRDWIFAGSLGDCLREGKENASEQEVWQTLEKVKLADFVRENGGLSMSLHEGGENLSGGQKQRISIARALLRDTAVYIFDEATSNIDVESEKAILDLIHSLKGKKTIVMISHRKENCEGADKIYFFEDGMVFTGDEK